MNGLEQLVEQLAEAVARRVLELQKAEAAKSQVAYLTPSQMAVRLGIAAKTLANQRSKGTGPKFVKVGGAVRYPVSQEGGAV